MATHPTIDAEAALAGEDRDLDLFVCPILDVPVGVLTMPQAIEQVNHWVKHSDRARLVTFTNVHMVVEAQLRSSFLDLLKHIDLNCPDGAPVFWMVQKKYPDRVNKISGPDFMPLFCQQSAALGQRHFLYGGSPGVAQQAAEALERTYPGLQVVGHFCPPFRKPSDQETRSIIDEINQSGADIVWVCLGCPKQEEWMYDMREHLNVKVMLAVGQAFDILAGRTERAPAFLSSHGLEWAYRLVKEPRRLWKRYFVTNLLFVFLILRAKLEGLKPWGNITKQPKL